MVSIYAGDGCEGLKTSKPAPITVATSGRPLPADSLQGVCSVGAVTDQEESMDGIGMN